MDPRSKIQDAMRVLDLKSWIHLGSMDPRFQILSLLTCAALPEELPSGPSNHKMPTVCYTETVLQFGVRSCIEKQCAHGNALFSPMMTG
jgi:hypothetical protein